MRTSATFTFFAASANKFCKEKNQEINIQRSDLLSFWNPSAPRYQAREEPGRRGVRGYQCPSCCLPSPHGRGAAPPPPASPCWSPPACPRARDRSGVVLLVEFVMLLESNWVTPTPTWGHRLIDRWPDCWWDLWPNFLFATSHLAKALAASYLTSIICW